MKGDPSKRELWIKKKIERNRNKDSENDRLLKNNTPAAMGEIQRTKILTVQEVADTLRVHRSTITRYALSGQLRSHLVGNRRLFKESDVWEFFDNQVDRVCVIDEEA
jgi:excisionase family DNA binding protein